MDKNEVKETLKEMFRSVINNANDEKGRWITVKGTHVFIPDGANQEEVVKDFIEKKNKEVGWTLVHQNITVD